MFIWYILCSFGTFFPVLVPCTKKNLATLEEMRNLDVFVFDVGGIDKLKPSKGLMGSANMCKRFISMFVEQMRHDKRLGSNKGFFSDSVHEMLQIKKIRASAGNCFLMSQLKLFPLKCRKTCKVKCQF
jgi:hypothetical protein